MKRIVRIWILLVVVLVASAGVSVAQVVLSLDNALSKMTVNGTSSIHDWEMKIEKISGELNFEKDILIENVLSGSILVPVKSIVSHQSLMNRKAYSALEEDDYPLIKGALKKVIVNQGNYEAFVDLTIAGSTKTIKRNFKYKLNESRIEISGKWKLKMSDFSIDPPEALMGTIKTGDEITIDFMLVYVQK